jgi:hypothetical protein
MNGNLYVESVNLGMDHHGTEMLETFGVKFLDDGVEDLFNTIAGVNDTLLAEVNIEYAGGDSPRFSVDRLAATDSEELYRSDDGYGRMFVHDPGESFKVIASTMTFGALRDGDSLSMKPYLLAEMVDYFLGITTVTDIKEAFGNTADPLVSIYPNPAVSHTTVHFNLTESVDVDLIIYDELGRSVKVIERNNLNAGEQNINWNLRDASGQTVGNGMYYFQLLVDGKAKSSGKILVSR